ncbi:hypothetical protein [Subtercola sp. RTI3]|uniref:hypothetical protein n=1 Tax=Subtercola sp. RTI3 TaxID=3048639 RepID=UPI002B23C783|nr:hypothetical protein [Subtercola sp. RTI3]MEA9986259.1 hypothetical protein [Subtercola sp. RTI3]
MDLGEARLYEIEVWSQAGQRIADISALCFSRSYTLLRNDAELLTFSVDLNKFERYCLDNLGGMDPHVLLNPDVSDIKIKRAGQYLFGTQVVDVNFNDATDASTAGAAGSQQLDIVTITCTGYLNLTKDRYVTKSYAGVERTSIANDLLASTQGQPNGSLGITSYSIQFATGVVSDRGYVLDNVKLKLQELCALTDAPFDMGFDSFKVFYTYAQIGARRQDINLIWGGPLGNVSAFSLDRSAINLFNKIYGLGSGFGDAQLTSTQMDLISQANYYIREQIQQFSSVDLQPTLDQDTSTVLSLAKDMLELPVVTITTKEVPVDASGISHFFSVGDRIPLRVLNHTWLANINGLYRIEQIDVSIDENDFETIKLTFDNYQVNQSE